MGSGESRALPFGFRLPAELPRPISDAPELVPHLECWAECRFGPALAAANARLLSRHRPEDLEPLLDLLTPAVLDLGDNPHREELYRSLGPRDQHAYSRAADDVTEAQRKRRFLIQALFRAIALEREGEEKLVALLSPKVADHLRDQIALALLRASFVPPFPETPPCSGEALRAVASLLDEPSPHLVARAVTAVFRQTPDEAFDRIAAVLPDPERPTALEIARFNELVFSLPDDGTVQDRRWVRAVLPLMRFTYHADIALVRLGASEGKVAERRGAIGGISSPMGATPTPDPTRPSAPPAPPAEPPPRIDLDEQRAALEETLRGARLLGKGKKLLARAIRLWPTRVGDDAEVPIAGSRFGGAPDLPAGASWPSHDGRPLAFLAQVSLADVRGHDAEGVLPAEGLLSFFVDPSLSEAEGDYLSASRVLYVADTSALERASPPSGMMPAPTCTIEAHPLLMLPPPDHPAVVAALDKKQHARYVEKAHVSPAEGHQLLGYRDRVSRTPPPDGTRLLFQCVSDPVTATHFGDGVHLDFWIEEEALAERRFEDASTRPSDG